jgi:hypothetical protein
VEGETKEMTNDDVIPLVLGVYAILFSGFSILPSVCGLVLIVTAIRALRRKK